MKWDTIDIALAKNTRARREYASYARRLQARIRCPNPVEALYRDRSRILLDSVALPVKHQATFRASALILTDLALQGWRIRVTRDNRVTVAAPAVATSRERARDTIRAQELLKRDAQLALPSVRAFIQKMERKRLFEDRFVSIFDLMRDGHALSDSLLKARESNLNGGALSDVIKPYLQFVDAEKRCEFTGHYLKDIWRYFRHTWTNQYTSTPGRSVQILVRDSAAPNHPVMGIASIASPIIQISERDKWLGWHPKEFIKRLKDKPSAKLARWLATTVDGAVAEIYKADFIREGLITRWFLKNPNEDLVRKLRSYSVQQKKRHHRYSRRSDFRNKVEDASSVAHWRKQACTPLYKSKRAMALSELLEMRLCLERHFDGVFSAAKLKALTETATGRRIISKIVRKAKADRVGIAMADITVCGAVQPYNALLGGKLVSMLAISPAVIVEYQRRYAKAVSQIASSMAGRPIIRPSKLVYFGTTSLYGNGSSQYNRVKLPASLLGGSEEDYILYRELGQSESYGTSQFSDETIEAIVECLRQSTNGERVHSIFGEGVSPRLRKVREGLALLGFPEDSLLQHGRRRSVYGVMLAHNTRNYLLGIDRKPQYRVAIHEPNSNNAIISWWQHRWLSGRIQSDQVLKQVALHRHVHPIFHGARVPFRRSPNFSHINLEPD